MLYPVTRIGSNHWVKVTKPEDSCKITAYCGQVSTGNRDQKLVGSTGGSGWVIR